MPPQNMSLWHTGYFELKLLEKTASKGHSDPPLSPLKAGNKSPTWRYPPCTMRGEGILINRDRKFRAEKTIQTNLVTSSLISYPKPKLLCFVNPSEIGFLWSFLWVVYFYGILYTRNQICSSPVNLSYVNLNIREPKNLEGKKRKVFLSSFKIRETKDLPFLLSLPQLKKSHTFLSRNLNFIPMVHHVKQND